MDRPEGLPQVPPDTEKLVVQSVGIPLHQHSLLPVYVKTKTTFFSLDKTPIHGPLSTPFLYSYVPLCTSDPLLFPLPVFPFFSTNTFWYTFKPVFVLVSRLHWLTL